MLLTHPCSSHKEAQLHKVRWLFVVLLGALLLSTNQAAVAANPPAAGEVLINEYVAANSTEWIELYNTTGNDLDISGHYIDDVGGGGGSPKVIPASTIITAGGYYVLETSSLLNNSGDDVRFLDPTQSTVLDSTSYDGAESGHSWYRYRDGLDWSPAESENPTKGTSNDPMSPDAWASGDFEIHIFDVEQGDSQLIIFPSGYSVLIDVVEHSYASSKGAALVASKIQAILGTDTIDVGVLSHHHLDHIGYAGYGGFWGLIETYGISFDKVVDRDAGIWVDGLDSSTPDGLCDADNEIQWNNAGTVSGTSRNWICYATNSANTNIYNVRELADIGSTTQIDPPDSGALVQIIQSDAEDIYMADGTTPLTGDRTGMSTPPSENDYSIALYIQYGDIEYATAGDADGEYDTSSFGYTYNDVETLLASRYGRVDIMRANHHGSSHSTSQTYVDALDPDASAISCGNNSFGHPAQAVLDRLLATGDVYVTNTCDTTRNYGASVLVHGDIVIESTNGSNYTIDGVAYVASSPLNDVVINEFLAAPSSGPEWVELYNPTAIPIDISGAYIDDINGGGSPKQIPANTILDGGDYYVHEMNNLFNNGGDDVRFLLPDGSTVVDSYTYSSTSSGSVWYRSGDGADWSATMGSPTKGTANPEPSVYTVADLVINEVVPDPSSGSEWVELYNPTSGTIDLSGAYIDDIAGGGGAPKQIAAGQTIAAGGHWTMDTNSFFNNGGDDVRLLMPDGSTVVDSYTYSSSSSGQSWYRTPDGGSWSGSMGTPTKNASNP